jgi:hypothetical protein
MKSKDIKSLAYAFISEDVNVYFPDNDEECFIVEKLVCAECRSFWHTSLNECYFCGEINYYLYVCTSCEKKYSITNSTIKCSCGKTESKLIKACVNKSCITNTDIVVKSFSISENGVFDLDSSQTLSQMYCLKCGSPENNYLSFKVFVFNDNEETNFKNYCSRIRTYFDNGDILIIKKHIDKDELLYSFAKELNPDLVLSEISYIYKNMSELINSII